ncbi:MAG TPA: transglutaminase-like domain-containing protein [Alphaproteobacteria bacterium]|nr:transglutaminase-like domain-containing protein [Alphaproteobacteria bacterium]
MRRYVTPPLTPAHVFLGRIPKGYAGTQRTIEYIKALIRAGAKDFYVRQKAIDILLEKGVAPKDYRGEIKALFEWVQRNVRYTKDPFRVEVLHSARRLLELRAGDCDDMTILLGSMLEAIGHPVRLILTGPDPLRPRLFSHIYLEAFHKGRWIPLDATMPYPMGWAPRALVKKTFAMERGPNMMAEDMELQGFGAAAAVPDWLKGLIQAVRNEAIPPKDARVKSLWDLLRQRQLLGQSPWLKAVLQRIWSRGLSARPHPRTARRIVRRLRLWGIWPPTPVTAAPRPAAMRPLATVPMQPVRPVTVKPVGSVKPVNMQSIRPVQMPSRTPTGARK